MKLLLIFYLMVNQNQEKIIFKKIIFLNIILKIRMENIINPF